MLDSFIYFGLLAFFWCLLFCGSSIILWLSVGVAIWFIGVSVQILLCLLLLSRIQLSLHLFLELLTLLRKLLLYLLDLYPIILLLNLPYLVPILQEAHDVQLLLVEVVVEVLVQFSEAFVFEFAALLAAGVVRLVRHERFNQHICCTCILSLLFIFGVLD